MSEEEVYASLNELFKEMFLQDGIVLAPETTAQDIDGWDSFRHIELLLASEALFNIRFRSIDLDRIKNVGDLVRLIQHLSVGR